MTEKTAAAKTGQEAKVMENLVWNGKWVKFTYGGKTYRFDPSVFPNEAHVLLSLPDGTLLQFNLIRVSDGVWSLHQIHEVHAYNAFEVKK